MSDQPSAPIVSHTGPPPDTDMATIHIRCGTDLARGLSQAGFSGDYICFSDAYCQGPLVPVDSDAAWIDRRAEFAARAYGVSRDEARHKLADELELLRQASGYDRAVLWFEHDHYDQLILARILSEFENGVAPRHVELICIDSHPEVPDFIGLGQLSPAQLLALWPGRQPVTHALMALGDRVWQALNQRQPEDLVEILEQGTPELPQMAAALQRHLRELPWLDDGLSLSQRLILAELEAGPLPLAELFRKAGIEAEPLPYLGDAMFWYLVHRLMIARVPALIWTDGGSAGSSLDQMQLLDQQSWQRAVRLTEAGRTVLQGKRDFTSLDPMARWVGGMRIAPGQPDWRWSPKLRQPVLVPAEHGGGTAEGR
jgi:hypothetical protein